MSPNAMSNILPSLIFVLALLGGVASPVPDPVALVDPFIGTGGHGHTYPGASLPFGMVQLSPDTRLEGWDGCSGYHYSDSVIFGFSHTHLSGTGVPDYCDILLMPTTGPVRLAHGDASAPESGYCSRFRHETERAEPGSYGVHLDDYDIDVELTVSERAGLHRYRFRGTERANVIIDLTHRDPLIDASIRFAGDREIEGYRISKAWAREQHVYFVARFSRPFADRGIAPAAGADTRAGETAGDEDARAGAAPGGAAKTFVTFAGGTDEVLVKVGISAVSIDGARRNLDAEIPGWSFGEVRKNARREWERALGAIQIEGGTQTQRTIFYTALYHALLCPNLFMDVDGSYRGADLRVHPADGHTNYTVFSLWDTFRAAHPLFTIIERDRTVDFIRTFLAQYEQGGHLPVWELAANETWCMIGYHAVPVIADAYLKGIRGFDAEEALAAMKHSAGLDHFGLEYYREYGYLPSDKDGESVSKTLEYAYDDWCIAQMAGALGRDDDYAAFLRRAQSYKNIFDPGTGFMRAKRNGAWQEPFDPAEVSLNLTEANTWQYTFFVPHDIETLIDLLGGREAFAGKLDALFRAPSETTGRDQSDITGMIGQYAQGNEPSHHMAYLYAYAGQPWKTQLRVRQIVDSLYTAGPDGLCGNEDCGQMSAWYVLSALGFYPVTPGSTAYVIGTPLFPKAVVRLENGARFVIRAPRVSKKNIYIQSATLNGAPYTRSYIEHEDIMRGGELTFVMGSEPSTSWGCAEADAPRSRVGEHLILPVPFVAAGSPVFADSTDVVLSSISPSARIHYTIDGGEPTLASPVFVNPLPVHDPMTIRAIACIPGSLASAPMESRFSKIPGGWSIRLGTNYAPQYAAGGDLALIDGIRGGDSFRTGAWQGYQGVDLAATVSLGAVRTVHSISTGFLQDQGSWIFMPAEVEYSVSTDGATYDVLATVPSHVPPDADGSLIDRVTVDGLHAPAMFVRVIARSIGTCPAWHPGAGHRAWIFADEIVIE